MSNRCHGVCPGVRAVRVVGHVAAGDGIARGGEDAGVGVVAGFVVRIGVEAAEVVSFGCDGERAVAHELQRAFGTNGLIRCLACDGVRAADVKDEFALVVGGMDEI